MENVKLDLNENGRGHFFINENNVQLAEMIIEISGNDLTVYHTEVVPETEGKGLAKQLLKAMVDYVRQEKLKVIVLCPYVLMQFKRHPDEYGDIWENKPEQN